MGPVVNQLENAYGERVRFKRYVLDKLSPAEYEEMKRLADLAGFHVTPTFLVVNAEGRVIGKYEGVTSYLTLSRDLDRALEPVAEPPSDS